MHQDPEHLVVHSSDSWASDRLNDSPDQIADLLFQELQCLLSQPVAEPVFMKSHRWKFAQPRHDGPAIRISPTFLPEDLTRLQPSVLPCGDFLGDSRVSNVESAFLSGIAAAGHILRSLQKQQTRIQSR